jgi:hypothetical protein
MISPKMATETKQISRDNPSTPANAFVSALLACQKHPSSSTAKENLKKAACALIDKRIEMYFGSDGK